MINWINQILMYLKKENNNIIISSDEIVSISKEYDSFSESDKLEIDSIIRSIDVDESIYIYIISFIAIKFNIIHFKEILLDYFFNNKLDAYTNCTFEFNIYANSLTNNYEVCRKIHKKNVELMKKKLK